MPEADDLDFDPQFATLAADVRKAYDEVDANPDFSAEAKHRKMAEIREQGMGRLDGLLAQEKATITAAAEKRRAALGMTAVSTGAPGEAADHRDALDRALAAKTPNELRQLMTRGQRESDRGVEHGAFVVALEHATDLAVAGQPTGEWGALVAAYADRWPATARNLEKFGSAVDGLRFLRRRSASANRSASFLVPERHPAPRKPTDQQSDRANRLRASIR